MDKIQEPEEGLKINENPDPSSDDTRYKNQGVRPKVKNHTCQRGNKSSQNGSGSYEKINGLPNGASCSSSLSSTPPSPFCANKPLYEFDVNSEHSSLCSAKGRTLSLEDNDAGNEEKKRKTERIVQNDSSSGNEDGEELLNDDCCVYTYKGDQFADLPNSLFPVEMGVSENNPPQLNNQNATCRRVAQLDEGNHLGSSPEMDFLEMDFDPAPSLEQDSEEESDGFNRNLNSPIPELPKEEASSDRENELINSSAGMETCDEPQPGPSNYQCFIKHNKSSDCNLNNFSRTKDFYLNCCAGYCSLDKTFESSKVSNDRKVEDNSVKVNTNEGALEGRLEKKTFSVEKIKKQNDSEVDLKTSFDEIMLWTEQEAISKQMTLISPDASCGVTAVINAMLVLNLQFSMENVKEKISARLKSESRSIPRYLTSRSFAGVAHEKLIRGIHQASHGTLYARFFQMYPRRNIVLSRWLSYWMKKGAVPIATMNVQRDATPEDSNLDTRHHQMIFGVNAKGIYLTDPLECVQDEELWCRLTSPSVLKIKRSEIVSRWSPGARLKPLMFQSDERWKTMNVLGQVVNMIRESLTSTGQSKFLTQHISIPASSGITLVILRECSGYEELVSTADLPLLETPE